MIALAEQTALNWAEETSWGIAALADYKTLPLITENLTGLRRQVRSQKLMASHLGQTLFTSDENAVGDIDIMPDIGLLRDLLKLALMTNVVDHEASHLFVTKAKPNLATISTALSDALIADADDVMWLKNSATGKGKWCRFIRESKSSLSGVLQDLSGDTIAGNEHLSVRLRRFDPGQIKRSMTLMKQYGQASDWMQFMGMMIRRLEIGTSSDQMLTASASLSGKVMKVVSSAPVFGANAASADPLFLGATDIQLSMENSTADRIDLSAGDNFQVTGFRLVAEQSGLQPRYGLGSRYPDAMLGGKLMVYGVIDIMAGSHDLMKWFSNADPVKLLCHIRINDEVGFGFCLPRMLISEVTNAPLIAGEPVRHSLRFDAEMPRSSAASLIHFYTS
jgi:hypothetical protein